MKLSATLFLLAAIAAPAAADCPAGQAAMVESQLFFGRDIQDFGEVSDADWTTFVRDVATEHFRDGFTVLDGAGYWSGCDHIRDHGGCERMKLMIVQYPAGAGWDANVEAVIGEYIRRFRQFSVWRADAPVCTRSYGADDFRTRD